MRRAARICSVFGVISILVSLTQASDASPNIKQSVASTADGGQPQGTGIQRTIAERVKQGLSPRSAATTVLINLVNNDNATLAIGSKRVLSENKWAAGILFGALAEGSDLFEATMTTIEALPGQVNKIVTVTVTLFPDSAADIVTAASLSGEVTPDEAVQLARAAGADVTELTDGTTAGGTGTAAPPPLSASVNAPGDATSLSN